MGARIFTVDDNPVVTGVLALKLESLGHTVRPFANAAELLAALRRDRPDLLLLDVEMPDLNGLDLLALIKREKLLPDVPVLMLTAVDDPEFIARAHRAGASGWLTKPIDLDTLCAKLADMLGERPPIWTDDMHTVRGTAAA
ncbi:MAG: response regulator [Caulobacteraceae bacterium]|nr:response regulator [Caulobacter sp.]